MRRRVTDPVIIIPARYGSARYPGKPLAQIAGKPLIAHVLAAATRTGYPVYVATDDARIAEAVMAHGGAAVMTGPCNNGTERCAAAARLIGATGPVINWQGDSPLVPPHWIDYLLGELHMSGAGIATPVQRCSPEQASALRHEYLSQAPGGTVAVLDAAFRAIYFSKAPVPLQGPWWLHVGIYAYSPEALAAYGTEEGVLERSERLEQLRFLEKGVTIQCVPVDGPPIWEVNNPGDVATVAAHMGARQCNFSGAK